jgi:hypothetical protein
VNQSQIKYARERAKTVYDRKAAALKEQYTIPAVKLTAEQKIDAILNRRYSVVEDGLGSSSGHYWHQHIKFHDEREASFMDGYVDIRLELDAKYAALLDELILGDSETALSLIKAFEA